MVEATGRILIARTDQIAGLTNWRCGPRCTAVRAGSSRRSRAKYGRHTSSGFAWAWRRFLLTHQIANCSNSG
jgi:hypothetical protein